MKRSIEPGRLLDSKYEISKVLCESGQGVLYLAVQKPFNRSAVIKTPRGEASAQKDAIARFEREAKILAKMRHKYLVEVFSVGQLEDGLPYLAMEFIEGKSLEETLKNGPLPWERACIVGKQICEAMSYAHSAGILHRDLKPANILLLDTPYPDYVKVIDFGLGSFLQGLEEQKITESGTVLGSLHYLSPEMCAGQKADERSDIYSLGCVLYECVAGTPPFSSTNPIGILQGHKNELPAPPSKYSQQEKIPAELDAIILKALEKKSENRFESMRELEYNLNAVMENAALSFDISSIASKKNSTKKGVLALCALLCTTALIIPVTLKLHKVTNHKQNLYDQNQTANQLLRQIAHECKLALEFERKGDRRKARESADRSTRLMIRELVSPRDLRACMQNELQTIDVFKNLGSLILQKNRRVKQLVDLEKSRDVQNLGGHFHNAGMLSLLSASINNLSGYSIEASDNYCAAIEAFAKSKEMDLVKRATTEANAAIKADPSDLTHFLKSRLAIAAATADLANKGNPLQAIKIADTQYQSLQKSPSSLIEADLCVRIADLYQRANASRKAAEAYHCALLFLTTEDGDYQKAWEGLASAYEALGRREEALAAFNKLKILSTINNDLRLLNEAERDLERLGSTSDSNKSSKEP